MTFSDYKVIQDKNFLFIYQIISFMLIKIQYNIFLVYIINIIDNLVNYIKSLKDIIFYNI